MIFSFLTTPIMAIEILAAEFVFCLLLNRKSAFWQKCIICSFVCVAVTIWIEIIYFITIGNVFEYGGSSGVKESVFKFVYYFIIFLMTIATVFVCYRASFWTILFYCSAGYAAQHIAVNIASFSKFLPFLNSNFAKTLVEIGVCAITYFVVYLVFVRGKVAGDTNGSIKNKALLSFGVIFICIGISRITTDNVTRNSLSVIAETLNAVVSCVLVLNMFSSLTENEKIQQELNVMNELIHREKEQFRLTKENIELINIKCHDLKHQISALRKDSSEAEIKKIEEAVMIYDSTAKTGNDILDVILTDKSLYCDKNRIRLKVVANGEDLKFMDSMDIYSLFGNALSNAIECVSAIKDESRRCITVNVRTVAGLLSVHIENYYDGSIEFENGFPVTSKDKDYHGYGMKSMQYIAKSYNGCMTVKTENGRFVLDFVFPIF